ncbi:MAG: helix-turn-helix domain-containing protein [Candidatus Saccharimonadales bacterium]
MIVDNSLENKVVRYLKQLGLEREQALVYLFLLQNGPNTVLKISRGLKTGRTKLYPLLDDLAAKQLITIHERHYGTSYEAQKPDVIEFLVSERERKAEALRSSLPAALNILKNIEQVSPTHTKIIEYRGVDGLKQMNFNLTKAQKEYRVFELAGLDKHLGDHFAGKMRERYAERGLTSYDITNRPNRSEEPGAELPNAKIRYIDPKIFTIEFETYIYDNCVGLLSYEHDDIFGVEIYSEKLARQQRQIFDLLWSQGTATK